MNVIIKPHHLLDIFKLYGSGIEIFVEDIDYHHDFYKVANLIVQNKVMNIRFTKLDDAICKPCRYLDKQCCSDTFVLNDKELRKHDYNIEIDEKIMQLLGLEFDHPYSMHEVMSCFTSNLSMEIIHQTWKQCGREENVLRYQNTRKGIRKHNTRYSTNVKEAV